MPIDYLNKLAKDQLKSLSNQWVHYLTNWALFSIDKLIILLNERDTLWLIGSSINSNIGWPIDQVLK